MEEGIKILDRQYKVTNASEKIVYYVGKNLDDALSARDSSKESMIILQHLRHTQIDASEISKQYIEIEEEQWMRDSRDKKFFLLGHSMVQVGPEGGKNILDFLGRRFPDQTP